MNKIQSIETCLVHFRIIIVRVNILSDGVHKVFDRVLKFNKHSRDRATERNISIGHLATAVIMGVSRDKNGMIYTGLTREMIPEKNRSMMRESNGLVVLHEKRSGIIRTCFWNDYPESYIERNTYSNNVKTHNAKVIEYKPEAWGGVLRKIHPMEKGSNRA
jgi:hypothetical protein